MFKFKKKKVSILKQQFKNIYVVHLTQIFYPISRHRNFSHVSHHYCEALYKKNNNIFGCFHCMEESSTNIQQNFSNEDNVICTEISFFCNRLNSIKSFPEFLPIRMSTRLHSLVIIELIIHLFFFSVKAMTIPAKESWT